MANLLFPCVVFFSLSMLQVSGQLYDQASFSTVKLPPSCQSYPRPSVDPNLVYNHMKDAFAEAEKNIKDVLDKEGAPGGVVVSLVYRDKVLWSKGFGLINMTDPKRGAPTNETGFRIGSITKLLTSLLTLIIRDKGSLRSLNANVSEYLPEFTIKNPFATNRGVTFRQLMSHMSGLPRATPCEDLFVTGCNLSDPDIYKNLAEIELLFPPGEQPLYSNLGFGLLGKALEKIALTRWKDAVQKLIFEPLHMTNSGNTFTPEAIKHIALGYYPHGTQADFISMGWDSPAGQTYASAADLSRLMMLVFKEDEPVNITNGQILDGETIREWLQPAYLYPDTTGFSYPWELLPLENYQLHTKDGRINGYMSEFQMATQLKTGIVFLQSCDGCTSHSNITSIMQTLILQMRDQLQALQPGPKIPINPKEYFGGYTATVDGAQDSVNISMSGVYGVAVSTQESGYTVLLEYVKGDEFQSSLQGFPGTFSCYALHAGHIGQRVYFQRNDNGDIASLTMPGTVYGKVYKKTS